jgi:hypothetical protein
VIDTEQLNQEASEGDRLRRAFWEIPAAHAGLSFDRSNADGTRASLQWAPYVRETAVTDLDRLLRQIGVADDVQPQKVIQRGSRLLAVGVPLPLLTRALASVEPRVRERSIVAHWAIGLNTSRVEKGPYVGVRIGGKGNYTVPQALHDRVWSDLAQPLSDHTGVRDWERRGPRDWWSIWCWALRGPHAGADFESDKNDVMDIWWKGLAAMRGIAWSGGPAAA